MMVAKAHDVIIDKSSINELEKYKQENESLKNKLNDTESKIKKLIEEKGELKGQLSVYARDVPKNDTFEGAVDE